MNTVLPYVRDNRLRALAVTSSKRSALMPDLPTMAEAGLAGFEAAAWQGIVMPVGTPADIVQKLNAEVNKALQNPDLRGRLAAQGADILGGTSAEYAAYLRAEMPRWAKAVKDSGAKPE
jgi:tripartite-type tricarboxylate transporter receptor subunit TctC